jgi:hypothetical protein
MLCIASSLIFGAREYGKWRAKEPKNRVRSAPNSADDMGDQDPVKSEGNTPVNRYYQTRKITDLRKAPRTWRTQKDPFEKVWVGIKRRQNRSVTC